LGGEGGCEHLEDIAARSCSGAAAPAGRGALVRTWGREGGDPQGAQACFSRPLRRPLLPPPPRPSRLAGSGPAEPPSLAARPRQRAPSVFRKTPPFFHAPGESPSFSRPRLQACQ
ncbi:hypothetical protein H1C71_015608, partial [Ictidomys tridecemlineatus]